VRVVRFTVSASNLHKSESGNKSRVNLTWHITPGLSMAYYTYSQGFRPGGFKPHRD